MARVDCVLIAVRSPKRFTDYLLESFGLSSYHGGRLAGIGTESHIVPLGEGYLDLISVVDEREASSNPLGRCRSAVSAATQESDAKFLSWGIRPEGGVQTIADRLGLVAHPFKRALPDGGHVACKIVGLQQAVEDSPLPFFIEWPSKEEQPDQVLVEHIADPMGFAWLEVNADQRRTEEWIGEAMVPLQFTEGSEANSIEAAGILTEGEAIVLKASDIPHISDAGQDASKEDTADASMRTPLKGEEDKSTFAAVLDSIEQAIETAAVAVETMAGGVTSPQNLSDGLEGHSGEAEGI